MTQMPTRWYSASLAFKRTTESKNIHVVFRGQSRLSEWWKAGLQVYCFFALGASSPESKNCIQKMQMLTPWYRSEGHGSLPFFFTSTPHLARSSNTDLKEMAPGNSSTKKSCKQRAQRFFFCKPWNTRSFCRSLLSPWFMISLGIHARGRGLRQGLFKRLAAPQFQR